MVFKGILSPVNILVNYFMQYIRIPHHSIPTEWPIKYIWVIDMPKERNLAAFASFGADLKQARKALGLTQKSFAETIGIDPRYLVNIENRGALPSLAIFYDIIQLCKLPVDRYFHPDAITDRDSRERERVALKLKICPDKYLSIIEGTIDAVIKHDEGEST